MRHQFHELTLSDTLYARLRDLLLARLGLHFPEHRRDDLARGLSQVAQERGHTDLSALASELLAGEPGAWEAVVSQLTIGETYFFRNDAQFAALRKRILPELLSRRVTTRSLRVWSAGCATGEEPYSLAMVLIDAVPTVPPWQVSVLGTDLNPWFLERAREASYGGWSFREIPEALRDRFFSPVGQRWRLNPDIQRTVLFSQLNLAESSYPALTNGTAAMDLIFCRNVLIYFDATTMRAVIDRLFDALAPGGWLMVGHAEPNVAFFQRFETINAPGTVLYRKPADAPLFSVPGAGQMAAPTAAPTRQPESRWDGVRSQSTLPTVTSRVHTDADTEHQHPPGATPIAPSPREPDPLIAARHAADRGEWERARELTEAIAAAEPLFAAAHELLGQIYEHAGAYDTALAAYRRSRYLDPMRICSALGMADVWRQAGVNNEARRGYRVALRLLAHHPAGTPIADADGASAAELAAYARLQLDLMDTQGRSG